MQAMPMPAWLTPPAVKVLEAPPVPVVDLATTTILDGSQPSTIAGDEVVAMPTLKRSFASIDVTENCQ